MKIMCAYVSMLLSLDKRAKLVLFFSCFIFRLADLSRDKLER